MCPSGSPKGGASKFVPSDAYLWSHEEKGGHGGRSHQVVEVDAPADVTAIEWMLVTTVAVHRVEDAVERVEWYGCRWGIEVWHRIVKSGCRIEARQLATGARLERCLTL